LTLPKEGGELVGKRIPYCSRASMECLFQLVFGHGQTSWERMRTRTGGGREILPAGNRSMGTETPGRLDVSPQGRRKTNRVKYGANGSISSTSLGFNGLPIVGQNSEPTSRPTTQAGRNPAGTKVGAPESRDGRRPLSHL